MSKAKKILTGINNYQQKHHITAFCVAVIKKYNDDSAGRQAALLTYYGFLSLFPLLLVLITITNVLVGKNTKLGHTIIHGVTNYFPLLGNQLSTHVHSLSSEGLPLILGILLTLYGARGVANAFSHGVQNLWHVPKNKRPSFPQSLYKSLGIVVVGGVGLVIAAILASLTTLAGHNVIFKVLSLVVNLMILFWLFRALLHLSLPIHITNKETRVGAAAAAIGLVLVQLLGGYLLAKELKHLSALYSYFAVALALLFWLYLQAQVLYYSIEIAIVSSKRLWPRSLDSNSPTTVDQQITTSRLA